MVPECVCERLFTTHHKANQIFHQEQFNSEFNCTVCVHVLVVNHKKTNPYKLNHNDEEPKHYYTYTYSYTVHLINNKFDQMNKTI